MTTSPTSGKQWEQPHFDGEQPRPYVTGPVLLPVTPHFGIATQVDVPPPGPEERRLNTVRALVWPMAIVICILTGSWWPLLILPLVVGAVLKSRLRELRRERYAAAQLLR
jgi:hypothetical protein